MVAPTLASFSPTGRRGSFVWVCSVGLVCLVCLGASAQDAPPSDPSPAAPEATAETEAEPTAPRGLEHWSAEKRERQRRIERDLRGQIVPARLRAWHDVFASEPHDAGTPGDQMVIRRLAEFFEDMGFEVEVHEFWAYLSEPVFAEVEVLAGDDEPIALELVERALDEDPWSTHADLRPGWNAYSGSGAATAEVVYANYGRKADFEALAARGIDCAGKIVLCRYGGNYRGYKVKFAEAAGAAGVLMYTDPDDSGWRRGLAFPEGGWATATSIQRGSIKTLGYEGDPLTPFVEATRDAERLDPESVALPTIPVQPLGWGAAQEILSRMRGASVPNDWQGGLPLRYRLTGGPDLRVRLTVLQERKLVSTANVVGTLRGSEFPEQAIVIGCHHDAWGFGAGDPTAGLITVMEAARAWSELARAGKPPARSLVFAGWGAEEHGIIGSVEWVEKHRERLLESAVAYLNVDMAAMGFALRASASPSLQRVITEALAAVPAPPVADPPAGVATALDAWLGHSAGPEDRPTFGDLGGGSDHVGFVALAGVPCAALGAGGSDGVAYHSHYDDLAWYRQVVGDDYESARLVTDAVAVLTARLANAPVVPLDPARYGPETLRHLRALSARGRSLGVFASDDSRAAGPIADQLVDEFADEFADELAGAAATAEAFGERAHAVQSALHEALAAGALERDARAAVDARLMACDRAWLDAGGLPNRPWYQNRFAATDEDSGYAPWMLPFVRHALEHRAAEHLAAALAGLDATFAAMSSELDAIEALVQQAASAASGTPAGR